MGISLFKGSECECKATPASPTPPNPNPQKFRVLEAQCIGPCTIAMIEYEGCTNYEGRKILVWYSFRMSPTDLTTATFLDPHFCKGQHISPIARFVPTPEGWAMAETFARAMEIRSIS